MKALNRISRDTRSLEKNASGTNLENIRDAIVYLKAGPRLLDETKLVNPFTKRTFQRLYDGVSAAIPRPCTAKSLGPAVLYYRTGRPAPDPEGPDASTTARRNPAAGGAVLGGVGQSPHRVGMGGRRRAVDGRQRRRAHLKKYARRCGEQTGGRGVGSGEERADLTAPVRARQALCRRST